MHPRVVVTTHCFINLRQHLTYGTRRPASRTLPPTKRGLGRSKQRLGALSILQHPSRMTEFQSAERRLDLIRSEREQTKFQRFLQHVPPEL
jgi:hypothetical protein